VVETGALNISSERSAVMIISESLMLSQYPGVGADEYDIFNTKSPAPKSKATAIAAHRELRITSCIPRPCSLSRLLGNDIIIKNVNAAKRSVIASDADDDILYLLTIWYDATFDSP